MMSSDHIIDVSETDFEYEVLSYSQNIPVVVDFWATWCGPCKQLGPLLERLAIEGRGSFRLARVNVDDNPNLALLYGVRSIPTVKAFSSGQVVTEFSGNIPESRLRDFLNNIVPPSPADLALERAESLLALEQWVQAEGEFRSLLQNNPDQPASLLGLARALLAQGKGQEAAFVLHNFPASRQFAQAETLQPLADAMTNFSKGRLPDDNDIDAAYTNAIRLASRGNTLAALDGLLEVLRQNKHYRSDRARQVFLGLLGVLGDESLTTRQYRAELASVLF
jgi:putative thioredoxin